MNIFTFLLIAWVLYLSSDISKLKKKVHLLSMNENSYAPLSLNIGNTVVFEFYELPTDLELYNQECVILDIDSNWIQVRQKSRKSLHLINIDLIKGFQIKTE